MISGPGLGLLIVSITFASIDWVMSLEPEWMSTIFGLIFVASWSLSALAFTIVVMSWLSKRAPDGSSSAAADISMTGAILLLALVMLWTYFAFSQYLIIWSGNLAEETTWYVARTAWRLGRDRTSRSSFCNSLFPFLTLLSRAAKKSSERLASLAVADSGNAMLLDVIWLIEPAFDREHFHRELDGYCGAPSGMGGLWIAAFAWRLANARMVPIE